MNSDGTRFLSSTCELYGAGFEPLGTVRGCGTSPPVLVGGSKLLTAGQSSLELVDGTSGAVLDRHLIIGPEDQPKLVLANERYAVVHTLNNNVVTTRINRTGSLTPPAPPAIVRPVRDPGPAAKPAGVATATELGALVVGLTPVPGQQSVTVDAIPDDGGPALTVTATGSPTLVRMPLDRQERQLTYRIRARATTAAGTSAPTVSSVVTPHVEPPFIVSIQDEPYPHGLLSWYFLGSRGGWAQVTFQPVGGGAAIVENDLGLHSSTEAFAVPAGCTTSRLPPSRLGGRVGQRGPCG